MTMEIIFCCFAACLPTDDMILIIVVQLYMQLYMYQHSNFMLWYSTISCTLDYIKCDLMFDGHGSTVHVHGHMGACMHPHMYKRQCT